MVLWDGNQSFRWAPFHGGAIWAPGFKRQLCFLQVGCLGVRSHPLRQVVAICSEKWVLFECGPWAGSHRRGARTGEAGECTRTGVTWSDRSLGDESPQQGVTNMAFPGVCKVLSHWLSWGWSAPTSTLAKREPSGEGKRRPGEAEGRTLESQSCVTLHSPLPFTSLVFFSVKWQQWRHQARRTVLRIQSDRVAKGPSTVPGTEKVWDLLASVTIIRIIALY